MQGLEENGEFFKPDLYDKKYVKEVSFVSVEKSTEEEEVENFYAKKTYRYGKIEVTLYKVKED